MKHAKQFYVDGQWVDPISSARWMVVNPATEEPFAEIALAGSADVDRAVQAARAAFPTFSRTPVAERKALLARIIAAYRNRYDEIARIITKELGSPWSFARDAQTATGVSHLAEMVKVLESYEFDELRGSTRISREPIGVCGLITPWNWPINQVVCKVVPALAAGCTMVLKPSEYTPLSAMLFAEVLDEAGVPPGVFNLVQGDGPTAGHAIASHPDVDMVSFTGSTRAGINVAKAAANTVKRVAQELGGKSANILLPDVDFEQAVTKGVARCFLNSGQSCAAPTRMLVPADRLDSVVDIAMRAAATQKVGHPDDETTVLGPVVNRTQFERIQRLISAGIAEGARLVIGGLGRPEGLNRGYYIRPTIFCDVRNDMMIAREEIFGPVLSILSYSSEAEAIEIANDTAYGLGAFVQSADLEHARRVAERMRAGSVWINYPPGDIGAPFGGYKQSGNGRENGAFGLEEFLETKASIGYAPA